MNSEVVLVLVVLISSGTPVRPQLKLGTDYLTEYLSVSYDHKRNLFTTPQESTFRKYLSYS